MISDVMMYVLTMIAVLLATFVLFILVYSERRLIHRLYAGLSSALIVWLVALVGMRFAGDNMQLLFVLDAITNIASSFSSPLMLLISLTFTRNLKRLEPWMKWLFLVPTFIALVICTNPLHHLHYRVFSIINSEIVFGPFMLITGGVAYSFLIYATYMTLSYGIKCKHELFFKQSILITIGIIIPLLVSAIATLQLVDLSITATPFSILVTIICHGIAIFYLNFLNIKPVAYQKILDNISDGYIIFAMDGYVINYNRSFRQTIGTMYNIELNTYLSDLVNACPNENKNGIFNLITALESCIQTLNIISYEQALVKADAQIYYSVEMTPLVLKHDSSAGAIAIFKDVTNLKLEMRQRQENLSRTLERERLASLGQMIGGIAHNLKTPIMSVSGSVGALKRLVTEYNESVGDEEVTPEDHREIAGEMSEWISKIQDCCSYMSDIITTFKGLATNMNASDIGKFTMDELYKRVQLLMRHSLMRSGCILEFMNELPASIMFQGDINNLVQVLNNLVDNAIDATKSSDNKSILLRARLVGKNIQISVSDHGMGVPEDIRKKLFHEMITSKGAMGTGLGLYISNTMIKGKFGGTMWMEDNPEGGTIFYISIPIETPNDFVDN